SSEHRRALATGSARRLLHAAREAPSSVLVITALHIGRAENEPAVGVRRIEGHRPLAERGRKCHLSKFERLLRRLLRVDGFAGLLWFAWYGRQAGLSRRSGDRGNGGDVFYRDRKRVDRRSAG